MRFPSEWFYNGELEAAPEVRNRGILDFDTPMNWIDTSEMDFHEEFVGESFGRINKQEANLLLQELEAYINRIGKTRILDERIDFGLISPYKAQVQYLRSKSEKTAFYALFAASSQSIRSMAFKGRNGMSSLSASYGQTKMDRSAFSMI